MIMVFSKQWFKKYNNTLCWFANAPVIKYWFRWLLRIHNDIPFNVRVNRITPNSFTYDAKLKGDKIELTTDFRTHDKFSKRLYYGLKPLWYLMHFTDWAMLDRCEQLSKLSFGFSTLTFYPDASHGSTTVDGYVYAEIYGATWAQIRDGTGDGANDTATTGIFLIIQRAGSTSSWMKLTRSIFTFDTDSITSEGTISAAVLSVRGNSKENLIDAPNAAADVYLASPASNNALVAGDYDSLGTTSQTGSPIVYNNWQTSSYTDFTLSATGRGNISKTGISKFGIRESAYDVANSAPGYGSTNNAYLLFQGYFADQDGTSTDPKLVVTYTAVTFIPQIMMIN